MACSVPIVQHVAAFAAAAWLPSQQPAVEPGAVVLLDVQWPQHVAAFAAAAWPSQQHAVEPAAVVLLDVQWPPALPLVQHAFAAWPSQQPAVEPGTEVSWTAPAAAELASVLLLVVLPSRLGVLPVGQLVVLPRLVELAAVGAQLVSCQAVAAVALVALTQPPTQSVDSGPIAVPAQLQAQVLVVVAAAVAMSVGLVAALAMLTVFGLAVAGLAVFALAVAVLDDVFGLAMLAAVPHPPSPFPSLQGSLLAWLPPLALLQVVPPFE